MRFEFNGYREVSCHYGLGINTDFFVATPNYAANLMFSGMFIMWYWDFSINFGKDR